MTGIDKHMEADLWRFWLWTVVVLSDGDFIYQVDCGPLSFSNAQLEGSSLASVLFRLARWLVRSRLLRHQRILFIGPRARSAGNAVRFEEGDMIGGVLPGGGPFDVVRVMNVLNLAYFDDATVEAAARTLAGWVADGGLLLIGRSDGDTNRATLFCKTGPTLWVVDRLNDGSEVERHVLAVAS
ncbi:hypothetical protein WCLP8_3250001 [uncultured Gammaproteobacteria bacterium]